MREGGGEGGGEETREGREEGEEGRTKGVRGEGRRDGGRMGERETVGRGERGGGREGEKGGIEEMSGSERGECFKRGKKGGKGGRELWLFVCTILYTLLQILIQLRSDQTTTLKRMAESKLEESTITE